MGILIVIISSYLIGSISFAIIVGYLFKGIDIRTKGSGNAGATNVKRILGTKLGALVMLLDFTKGFVPLLIISTFDFSINIIIVKIIMLLCLILGHLFPIYFSFKGGKGVATAAGGISAMFPPAFPFSLTVFILTYKISKHVSLASLFSAWTLPIFYYIYSLLTHNKISSFIIGFFIFIPILITISHRSNIVRLLKGSEL